MAGCCFPVLVLLLACVATAHQEMDLLVYGRLCCCFPVLVLLLACVATAHQGGCRRFKFLPPKNGHYLRSHVFLNLTIGINTPCHHRCAMESECVSVNFGPPINDKIVCELSNSDHLQHPQDLKPRHDWTYRGTENLCASYPCLNNGKCYLGYADKKYLCECPAGYTGENCGKDVDECQDGTHDCHANANCKNIPGSFNCSCKKGYTGNGSLCLDANECNDGTYAACHENATCTNIPGSFNCSCNKGFIGDGRSCADVDECSNGTHDCHENATCTNIPGSFNCSCYNDFIGDGRSCAAKSCQKLKSLGQNLDGIYDINPDGQGIIRVFCDQTTDGGGWIMIQRRISPYNVSFDRLWLEYRNGFGDLSGEFWLGNENLHRIAASASVLRFDLTADSGQKGYAKYGGFTVGDEAAKFQWDMNTYEGNIGNAIYGYSHIWHNIRGMKFSTKDEDNDNYGGACSPGWWMNYCGKANLNHRGPFWDNWGTIVYTVMKIRKN